MIPIDVAILALLGDLPAIKCGVCEALMDVVHAKVASMRADAPFGKVCYLLSIIFYSIQYSSEKIALLQINPTLYIPHYERDQNRSDRGGLPTISPPHILRCIGRTRFLYMEREMSVATKLYQVCPLPLHPKNSNI